MFMVSRGVIDQFVFMFITGRLFDCVVDEDLRLDFAVVGLSFGLRLRV